MLYYVLTDLTADLEAVDVIRHEMDSAVDPAYPRFLGGRFEAGEMTRSEVLSRIAGVGEREMIAVDRGQDGRGRGAEGAMSRDVRRERGRVPKGRPGRVGGDQGVNAVGPVADDSHGTDCVICVLDIPGLDSSVGQGDVDQSERSCGVFQVGFR